MKKLSDQLWNDALSLYSKNEDLRYVENHLAEKRYSDAEIDQVLIELKKLKDSL